ncbi:hypothetical protein [Nonomuraea jiangxiensis]|uniref:Uncharacterized protein n=1 Tax=Nonomuraea jiangxiensis TaxID=633440 RepID=A0A1G9N3W4_9ACTN|nr:hypothetical protein [Nonomuraea jiangxiensis]SDL81074.1 hypothetical protein SAMN05421869_13127 [Nonomuraea jiangxiensis]
MHVGRPVVRALRAAVFTAVCLLASAALHLFVGGAAIGPGSLVLAAATTWAGAYALGYRQCGWPELLALCGVSQYGLHQLFAADEPPFVPVGHGHGTGPGMLLIHVMVALGSSWWLARGELALAALLHLGAVRMGRWWRLLATALSVLVACVPVTAHPGPAPGPPETARRVPALLTRTAPRRGPPARRRFRG